VFIRVHLWLDIFFAVVREYDCSGFQEMILAAGQMGARAAE
jgi:hypothetical protein